MREIFSEGTKKFLVYKNFWKKFFRHLIPSVGRRYSEKMFRKKFGRDRVSGPNFFRASRPQGPAERHIRKFFQSAKKKKVSDPRGAIYGRTRSRQLFFSSTMKKKSGDRGFFLNGEKFISRKKFFFGDVVLIEIFFRGAR